MLLHALGILSSLAAVVFAAFATRLTGVAAFGGAFMAAAIWLSPARFPDPAWAAVFAAGCSAAALWKRRWRLPFAAAGGVVTGIWATTLEGSGLPAPLALAVPLAAATAALVLVRRREDFAPDALRDEALMIVTAAGLILAAAPTIMQGFETAVALKAAPLGAQTPAATPWALVLAGVCALGGCVLAIWRHR